MLLCFFFVIVAVAQSSVERALDSIAVRFDDAINQAMVPIGSTLMINGTYQNQNLRIQLLEFKGSLMSRLKEDADRVLIDFAESRPDIDSEITEVERHTLTDYLRKAWVQLGV